jgi:hypothetical protein
MLSAIFAITKNDDFMAKRRAATPEKGYKFYYW